MKIVSGDEPNLISQKSPGCIDVRDGQFRPELHLLAEPGILAGHRAGNADQDFRPAGPPSEAANRTAAAATGRAMTMPPQY